jgi:predicted transcriptional regulator
VKPRSKRTLEKALTVFGPLEARILRVAWSGSLKEPFVVKDVQAQMPELAYTTVMTTMNRLAEKGLLSATHVTGMRAHQFRVRRSPAEALELMGRRQVDEVLSRFGDFALAAFATRLDELSEDQRQRLRELGRK